MSLRLQRTRNAVIAALGIALFCAFATTFLAVTFEPVRAWSENQANCLNAESIERADFSNSDSPLGSTPGTGRTMRSGSAFELSCTYADGTVELVRNNEVVIKGVIFAFLTGFLPGFLIAFTVAWFSQRRDEDEPPAEPDPTVTAPIS